MTQLFDSLLEALRGRRPVCLVLIVAPDEGAGARLLLGPDGPLAGSLPPPPLGPWMLERACLAISERRTASVFVPDEVAPGTEVYFEPYPIRPSLVIVGGGHVGKALYDLAAPLPIFDITVVDDRPQYANAVRFPLARTVCCDFRETFQKVTVDPETFVSIVTRGHSADRLVLRDALATPARYLGMIGSRRKVLLTFRHLMEDGIDRSALHRVHAPLGLAIGAAGAAEIAVSILAELIAVKNGVDPRTAGSLGVDSPELVAS